MGDNKLYDLLEVSRISSDSEIKQAYELLVNKLQSQKCPSATEKLKDITYAYEVLSNPEKREIYNTYGLKGLQQFNRDPLDDENGDNVNFYLLKVSLEDMYVGNTVKFEIDTEVICDSCNGLGGKPEALSVCDYCHGDSRRVSYGGFLMTRRLEIRCPLCNGSGKKIKNANDICPDCNGRAVLYKTKALEVKVDKGMRHNQKIILRGEGNQFPGRNPDNLIVTLEQKPHPVFERIDTDLMIKHEITLVEALCGFEFVIKHLDGRDLLIRYSSGEVIKTGDIKRVAGEGMPQYQNPFEKGDLCIKFDVVFPENYFANEEQLKQLEAVLPPRPAFVMPTGEDVEEVNLIEYTPSEDTRCRNESYDSRNDEYMHAGPGIQCAHQ